MAYSPPTIGPDGPSIPSYPDVLAYLIAQFQTVYGTTVDLSTSSPDRQDLSIRALQFTAACQFLQLVGLSFNPQTAMGACLDLLGRLIGTPRKAASNSTARVVLTGSPGVVITAGQVLDVNGQYWNLDGSSVTIGISGSLSTGVTAQTIGTITANPGDISIIATPTAGWTGVTNPLAASPGQPVEADSTYRARLLISQTKPSISLRAGTAAAIAAVPGVTRSVVYENPQGYTCSFGFVDTRSAGNHIWQVTGYPLDATMAGKTIYLNGIPFTIASYVAPGELTTTEALTDEDNVPFYVGDGNDFGPEHSITCVVEGGAEAAIAQAIYDNRGIGCYVNGSTEVPDVDVVPAVPHSSAPTTIRYNVLGYVPIYVNLEVQPLKGWTTAVEDAIIAGIVSYLNSLGIGESVILSELYGAALAARPNPDQPLFSIRGITIGAGSPPTMGSEDLPVDYDVAPMGEADLVTVILTTGGSPV